MSLDHVSKLSLYLFLLSQAALMAAAYDVLEPSAEPHTSVESEEGHYAAADQHHQHAFDKAHKHKHETKHESDFGLAAAADAVAVTNTEAAINAEGEAAASANAATATQETTTEAQTPSTTLPPKTNPTSTTTTTERTTTSSAVPELKPKHPYEHGSYPRRHPYYGYEPAFAPYPHFSGQPGFFRGHQLPYGPYIPPKDAFADAANGEDAVNNGESNEANDDSNGPKDKSPKYPVPFPYVPYNYHYRGYHVHEPYPSKTTANDVAATEATDKQSFEYGYLHSQYPAMPAVYPPFKDRRPYFHRSYGY